MYAFRVQLNSVDVHLLSKTVGGGSSDVCSSLRRNSFASYNGVLTEVSV